MTLQEYIELHDEDPREYEEYDEDREIDQYRDWEADSGIRSFS